MALNLPDGILLFHVMKRIFVLLAVLGLSAASGLPAQDAATQERLDKLTGQIDDLIAAQKAQQKQLSDLARDVDRLREQMSKPTVAYASQEDLKQLASSLRDVDRKRMEDNEKIHAELVSLRKILEAPIKTQKHTTAAPGGSTTEPEKPPKDEKGFPYTIQKGDTLSIIVQAYREKNIRITTDQILKANPGLKADKLKVGQQIWIPAPNS